MANFKQTVITKAAHNLMAKSLAGSANINFTRVATSKYDYKSFSQSKLESLTSLEDIKQYVQIDKVEKLGNASVNVITKITNAKLTEGYYVNAIGLFAMDPEEGEILYSVTVAETADYFPADNGVNCSGINLDLVTEVSNASNVNITVNYAGYATNEDIEKVNAQMNEIMNKSIGNFSKRLALGDITRIKLIGDSITEGQGSSDTLTSSNKVILIDGSKTYYETDNTHKCWANYFRNYINRVSSSTEFLNYGIGGATANYINSKKESLLDYNEDIVFVLLGTNDRFLTNNKPISDLETSLSELLAYIDSHSKLMIVLSPQPMNEYSDDENTIIKTTNVNYTVEDIDRLTQQICIENGYNFISLYKNFLKYCSDNKINYRHMLDEIGTNNPHPNDSGHELIWKIIQQYIGIPDIRKYGMLDKLYYSTLNLLNGWSAPSNLNSIPTVGRSKNTATITGVITGGTITQGTVIAIVPYQFRPNKQQNIYIKDWSNTLECVLSITANGELIVGYNSNSWDSTKNTMLNFTYILEG